VRKCEWALKGKGRMETELHWPAHELGKEGSLVRRFREKRCWSVKYPLGYSGRKETEKCSKERKVIRDEKKLDKER
jgi:hypothetical protein